MTVKSDSERSTKTMRVDIRNPQACKLIVDRLFAKGDCNALAHLHTHSNKLQTALQQNSGNSNEVA